MANIHPDISPKGLNQQDLVELLYQIVSSIKGICAKLDDDSGVTDATYEALCYTAIFTHVTIQNYKGAEIGLNRTQFISPTGVSDSALLQVLYDIFNSIETLTEQLDADAGVTDETYEALCYTALLTQCVIDEKGNQLGNGTNFYFRPGGVIVQRELVDCLYNIVNSIETLTEQLDADGTVNDTNYEALWFTATVLTRVENSKGSVVGN